MVEEDVEGTSAKRRPRMDQLGNDFGNVTSRDVKLLYFDKIEVRICSKVIERLVNLSFQSVSKFTSGFEVNQ